MGAGAAGCCWCWCWRLLLLLPPAPATAGSCHRRPLRQAAAASRLLPNYLLLAAAGGLTDTALARLGAPSAIPNRILQREALKSCLYVSLAKFIWSKPSNWLKVGQRGLAGPPLIPSCAALLALLQLAY